MQNAVTLIYYCLAMNALAFMHLTIHFPTPTGGARVEASSTQTDATYANSSRDAGLLKTYGSSTPVEQLCTL